MSKTCVPHDPGTQDFNIPGIEEGKFRVSYGTAGLRPQFDAQYEVFSVAGGSPSKVTLGNANLTLVNCTVTGNNCSAGAGAGTGACSKRSTGR